MFGLLFLVPTFRKPRQLTDHPSSAEREVKLAHLNVFTADEAQQTLVGCGVHVPRRCRVPVMLTPPK